MLQNLINEQFRSGRITADEAIEMSLPIYDEPALRDFLTLLNRACVDTGHGRFSDSSSGAGAQIRFAPDRLHFINSRRR